MSSEDLKNSPRGPPWKLPGDPLGLEMPNIEKTYKIVAKVPPMGPPIGPPIGPPMVHRPDLGLGVE